MEVLTFMLAPLVGGLIALSTNWLAIRMLFRPHKEVRVFGVKLPFTPGLIPKERGRLSKKLAATISTRLLSRDVLARELQNPDVWPLPDITVGELIKDFDLKLLTQENVGFILDWLLRAVGKEAGRLSEKHPLIDSKLAGLTEKVVKDSVKGFAGLFVSHEKVYKSIKEGIVNHLSIEENIERIKVNAVDFLDSEYLNELLAEKVMGVNVKSALASLVQKDKSRTQRFFGMVGEYFANNLPIEAMIENKLAEFDVAEMEEIILSVTGKELRVIVLLGGLLGFVIGFLVRVF